jgi:hypothetical protein
MWIAPVIAATMAVLLAATDSVALATAAPILFLWFVSPAIAWWVSRPLARREARLGSEQILFLRTLARRTWAFFETFVGPDDQWLPPDNQQEHPIAVIAHRTSPTNMGLSLLANLTAYDFGYIPAGQLLLRTANAMGTMATLERYEGHFYNWYDTQSGKPLPPLYVSSVDSGNLAGHLMTLRPGLAALADDRIIELRWFEGLTDTLRALADAIGGTAPAPLTRLRRDLETAYDSRPASIAAAREWLERLATGVVEVAAYVAKIPGAASASETAAASESAFWVAALDRQCRTLLDELAFLVPWRARRRTGRVERLAGLARDSDVARARRARGAIASRDRTGRARGRGARGSRGAGRSLPGRHRSESSRRAADGGNRAPGAAMRCARPDGVRFSLRSGSAFAGHRVQRRRTPARPELLRFARLRSTIREFRGDRTGTAAAGELVRPRAPSHVVRGPASPPVVERLDVRVPDAAPRDAHVRQHAARPDGSCFSRARSRTEAARSVGSRNAATTPSTRVSITNTARSESRGWD